MADDRRHEGVRSRTGLRAVVGRGRCSISPRLLEMAQREILRALRELGVPSRLVRTFPRLPRDTDGVLIYGSRARGDSLDDSDLDVLALVPAARASWSVGDISVSFYTADQLASGVGTLFGAHLRRDSKLLWDPTGLLQRNVGAMGAVDTRRLIQRAHAMSALLTTQDLDLPKYLEGLLRQARYLLRSCLYAQAIDDGEPCFSVREISRRLSDPSLVELLASRQRSVPSQRALDECVRRLRDLVGEFPESVHGSLEATVVNEWGKKSDLLSASFLALGTTGAGSMYAEVDKILL